MENEEKCTCGHEHEHNHDECDCGCGHDHHSMTIVTEENKELKCSILGTFDVEENEYIALLPEGEDEVLIYRFILHDDDSFELLNIETDEEFEKVEDVFFELFGEEAFEDEDYDEEDFIDEDFDDNNNE